MRRRKLMMEDLDRDIRRHMEIETQDNIERGMSPDEAHYAAVRKFGNVTRVKQQAREVWSFLWLELLLEDLRYGFRMLRRSPGFTTVAVLTLALGIGANTAIFSFIDAVLLRSLPVEDPQHLVVFSWTAHEKPKYHGHSAYGDCADGVDCSLSLPFFETVHAQADTFSSLAAFAGPLQIDFNGNGAASMAGGEFVSGDFFSALGVTMFLGRQLGPSDDARSAPPAIVLNYSYWQRAFGGDRSAVGRTVRLNNTSVVIVGVADPHFTNLTPGKQLDLFMPFSLADRVRSEWWGNNDRVSDAGTWWVVVLGRLKPGVSIGRAQAAATTIFRNEMLRGAKPTFKEADAPAIRLLPATQGLNGESSQIAPGLYLMMIAVGFVLLIACANVAGLMLARSATREKEMAVRLAMGAGRARIARQLLTESVMLSVIGGALGILVAVWGVDAITKLISSGSDQPFPFVAAPDWRVLVFMVGVTFLTGILFGLAPALGSTRVSLMPALKEGASLLPGGGAGAGRWFRLGDALVIAQLAMSIVVLVGAGLLVRTLGNLRELNPGFDTHNVLLFGINPTIAGYQDQQTAQLYRDLQQSLAALPGVISASYSEDALLSGNLSGYDVHLDSAPAKSNVNTATLAVGPDFFSTMRIPVLAGRTFTPADFASTAASKAAQKAAEDAVQPTPGSPSAPKSASLSAARLFAAHAPPVPVLVNEVFAREFFPNQNPVGKHMGDAEGEDWIEAPTVTPGYVIVGMVGNTKYDRLRRDIMPTMYLPLVANSAHFELRTAGDPRALVKLVRGVVSSADPNLPLFDVRTQTEQIEQTLFQERLMTRLSSFFGLLALALACIGLYGLLSYEVSRRTRELGIRLALGALQREVVWLVVRQGILLVLVGATVGATAAFGVTRFLASMLFEVRANDPVTMIAVAMLLTLVALAACYIPARRAMRVDPLVALRYE
jgi:predicted permease